MRRMTVDDEAPEQCFTFLRHGDKVTLSIHGQLAGDSPQQGNYRERFYSGILLGMLKSLGFQGALHVETDRPEKETLQRLLDGFHPKP